MTISQVSALTSSQLALDSYPGKPVPTGWIAVATYSPSTPGGKHAGGPTSADGLSDSVTVFATTSDGITANGQNFVVGFKGTKNAADGWSDLTNGGSDAWNSIKSSAAAAWIDVSSNNLNANVATVGDSLSGGMAQSFALLHQVNGYRFSSLPISPAAQLDISTSYGSVSAAISQWKVHNPFIFLHQDGYFTTAFFSNPFQSILYLTGSSTNISNLWMAGEALGILGLDPVLVGRSSLPGSRRTPWRRSCQRRKRGRRPVVHQSRTGQIRKRRSHRARRAAERPTARSQRRLDIWNGLPSGSLESHMSKTAVDLTGPALARPCFRRAARAPATSAA